MNHPQGHRPESLDMTEKRRLANVQLPKDKKALARFAENASAQAARPNAPKKKCDDLEPHLPHYSGTGSRRRYCPGLKHRSKLRGVPRVERIGEEAEQRRRSGS